MRRTKPHIRIAFNLCIFLVIIFCLSDTKTLLRSPKFLSKNSLNPITKTHFGNSRFLLESREKSLNSETLNSTGTENSVSNSICSGINLHLGHASECEYLKAHPECTSGGIIEYLSFFYCKCEKFPAFGYLVLGLWLVALFYMLGNTAADYFCCSLEKLSKLLRLPPTVAGVTLLPLGNGAPDVFASIAAFIGADAGEVGLNSVLGGAVFVSCVVAGSVALLVSGSGAKIDRPCFFRDVGFFMLSLIGLTLILIVGKVSLWGALAFLSIYAAYALSVAANELLKKKGFDIKKWNSMTPMQSISSSIFSLGEENDDDDMYNPLLDVESSPVESGRLDTTLPQWMWASNVAIYSNQGILTKWGEEERPPWEWDEHDENSARKCSAKKMLVYLIEWPLTLPRQLTIPIVEEDRWSKRVAVASVTLAPVLMAVLCNLQEQSSAFGKVAVVVGVIGGITFGILAYLKTDHEHPPRRFLFPWVFAGFVMSIVWFYIIANELVALLVSFGVIFEINPSVLGLTVLAWGNSMGDLMSNIALAMNGGDGVQIAMSGCYAGPMFNTLIGLGMSLFLGAWSKQPSSFVVPKDTSLFYTLGFLITGLLWALVVLPYNDMRPGRLLGVGLLSLYVLFLTLRLSSAFGLFSISGHQEIENRLGIQICWNKCNYQRDPKLFTPIKSVHLSYSYHSWSMMRWNEWNE